MVYEIVYIPKLIKDRTIKINIEEYRVVADCALTSRRGLDRATIIVLDGVVSQQSRCILGSVCLLA